jgi:hypothetical protein
MDTAAFAATSLMLTAKAPNSLNVYLVGFNRNELSGWRRRFRLPKAAQQSAWRPCYHLSRSCTLIPTCVLTPNIPISEARTVCVRSARTGLCGGRSVMAVPTATRAAFQPPQGRHSACQSPPRKWGPGSAPRCHVLQRQVIAFECHEINQNRLNHQIHSVRAVQFFALHHHIGSAISRPFGPGCVDQSA